LKVLPEIRNIQVGHVVVQISVSDKSELAEGVCVVPGAIRPRRMINFTILSSLFEKLRDVRDKTLVCKNRKPKKIT
jgi:hypothetical protein